MRRHDSADCIPETYEESFRVGFAEGAELKLLIEVQSPSFTLHESEG
jgi:hypothetical protein